MANDRLSFDLQLFAEADDAVAAKAAADKAASDKVAADKAASDKAAQDKIDAEKNSLDKYPKELQDHIRDLRKEAEKKTERIRLLEAAEKERYEKLAAFEKAEDERNRKLLEDEKKFKELADQEREKREKAEKERDEKLRSKDVNIIRAELRSLAREANIIDADDIKTIDIRELRVDDEGNVPGAKEAVEALKAAKPHWFKSADDGTNRRATTTTATSRTGPTVTGDDASKWDKARLAREWGTVRL